MTTSLYVDGFNLYYGLLAIGARSPYGVQKWIDPAIVAAFFWPQLAPMIVSPGVVYEPGRLIG